MKDITKFIREGVSLYDVACTYYEALGHEETEALFDLRNRKDFRIFVEGHGFRQTLRYRQQNRYWVDGCNFSTPTPVDEAWIERLVNDEVLDFIECYDIANGWGISYWDKVLDLDAVFPLIIADAIAEVKEWGEKEDTPDSFRTWLDGLNGICDFEGHTDCLSVLVTKDTDGNDSLDVQVNTPDDMSTWFVGIEEFDRATACKILAQIFGHELYDVRQVEKGSPRC